MSNSQRVHDTMSWGTICKYEIVNTRVFSNYKVLVKVIVVIIASPSTCQLKMYLYINVKTLHQKKLHEYMKQIVMRVIHLFLPCLLKIDSMCYAIIIKHWWYLKAFKGWNSVSQQGPHLLLEKLIINSQIRWIHIIFLYMKNSILQCISGRIISFISLLWSIVCVTLHTCK